MDTPLLVEHEKDDAELLALETITRAMEPLEGAARIRILRYISSRFFITFAVPQ